MEELEIRRERKRGMKGGGRTVNAQIRGQGLLEMNGRKDETVNEGRRRDRGGGGDALSVRQSLLSIKHIFNLYPRYFLNKFFILYNFNKFIKIPLHPNKILNGKSPYK